MIPETLEGMAKVLVEKQSENDRLKWVVGTVLANLREQRDTGLSSMSRDALIDMCRSAIAD